MNETQREAVATANAHLNNAALPTYTEVVGVLRYLIQQAEQSDLGYHNHALQKAQDLMARLRQV